MIHFSDAPPAPTQLKVLLSGEARKEHSKFIGTYTLQRSPINGNPWWKQGLFRKKVVWFHDLGFWTFTDFEDLGKSNATPVIGGPSDVDEWPNYIPYGWRYDSKGNPHEAGNDIIVKGT